MEPSSGVMKPKPLTTLNHLHLPFRRPEPSPATAIVGVFLVIIQVKMSDRTVPWICHLLCGVQTATKKDWYEGYSNV